MSLQPLGLNVKKKNRETKIQEIPPNSEYKDFKITFPMRKGNYNIRIGTSGWHYNHWQGLFYPAQLPKSKWLEYYAENFDAVEINNTFYQLPKEVSLKGWHKQAPKNFIYLLPKKQLSIFEFRHESWYCDDTFTMLDKSGVGFCIHDMPGKETPRIITSDVIYIRFHGPAGKYQGNYSKSALQDWANWLKEHIKQARCIYAYFNNDIGAYAVRNAKTLKEQFIRK